MNTIGIIVEYNPFHNGHLYHINEIKRLFKNSIIIAVMSGNFTQRGDTSIIDKYRKTYIALENKIDIVIELPFHYATQSADIFAKGSIEILNKLNVEYLVFGSESNDVELLKTLANITINNKKHEQNIKLNLKKGLSYPKSIYDSLKDLTKSEINTPNDILGIEYIKQIILQKSNIIPITIKRTNDYHSKKLEKISSATSIRESLKNNIDVKKSVPKSTYKYLNKELSFIDYYFSLLKYKIISSNDLKKYNLVDEGIENRLKKYILESNSLEEYISKIKTKRYTYNKIKRMLCHILVGFTKEENKVYKNINYIRVLGFSKKGQKYLSTIKKDCNLITNYSKNKDILNLDYKSSIIYNLIFENKLKEELNKVIKK